ncbi:hypothetical protein C8R44DRAFT_919393 [Mycena epipterygia]|nr:hypothetical protein C8R44DRAFT_919393 [Mycena epipterygia]
MPRFRFPDPADVTDSTATTSTQSATSATTSQSTSTVAQTSAALSTDATSQSDTPSSSAPTSTSTSAPTSTSTTTSESTPATTSSTTLSSTSSLTSLTSTSATELTSSVINSSTSTQTSTQLVSATSASSSPSSSASSSASTRASTFLQNKAAMAGVFSTIGILTAIVLIYCITRALRRRRARRLDRDMDAIALVPDSLRAIAAEADNESHRLPSLDLSPASHGSPYKPPSLSPPQHAYGFPPQRDYDYAASEYSNAGAAGIGAARTRSVTRGPSPPVPAFMADYGQPRIVQQPQRAQAQVYHSHDVARAQSQSALVHSLSQSSQVNTNAGSEGSPQAAPPLPVKDYLSNYMSPPKSAELSPTTEIPLSPAPALPNPYGQGEDEEDGAGVHKVLKISDVQIASGICRFCGFSFVNDWKCDLNRVLEPRGLYTSPGLAGADKGSNSLGAVWRDVVCTAKSRRKQDERSTSRSLDPPETSRWTPIAVASVVFARRASDGDDFDSINFPDHNPEFTPGSERINPYTPPMPMRVQRPEESDDPYAPTPPPQAHSPYPPDYPTAVREGLRSESAQPIVNVRVGTPGVRNLSYSTTKPFKPGCNKAWHILAFKGPWGIDLCSRSGNTPSFSTLFTQSVTVLNAFFVRALSDHLEPAPLIVNSVNPGCCKSKLGRAIMIIAKALMAFTTEEGRRRLVCGAVGWPENSDALRGQYLNKCHVE